MGALPRPDLAPGPARELNDALHELHHRAGWPSLRALARETGVSHTTVSKAFSSPRLPTWGHIELLAEAMDGDSTELHHLWLAASLPSTGCTLPDAPRIAGRRAELAAVRRHLETGTGLLLVTGEAGIGKTTLVQAAARAADTFVAVGHCLPLSTEVPFLALVGALRSIVDHDDRWLDDALTTCPDYMREALARLVPELDPRVDPGESEDVNGRQRLFASTVGALRALRSTQSVCVLIEDLHWADTGTLDLVEHLLSTPTGLSLVGTWRLDDVATPASHRAWWERVARLSAVRELELLPLNEDETAHQLALLGLRGPGDFAARVHARTQGQPLFTEQLAAHLEEEEPLPRLLSDLLDRRFDEMSGSAWPLVLALGVADRTLTAVQLEAATGLPPNVVTEELHELRRRRLVRTTRASAAELQHPLLAEAIRRRLVAGEAQTVHRSLARVLGAEADASPAEIAAHWQGAQDADRELEWRIAAARSSADGYATAVEAEQWLRALEVWPSGRAAAGSPSVTRAEAYLAAMDALRISLQFDRAAELSDAADERLGDVDQLTRAELLRRAADFSGQRDGPEAGLELIEEALATFAGLPECVGLVLALTRKAALLLASGRYADSAAATRDAAEVAARVGNTRVHRTALSWVAWHEALLGDVDQGVTTMARASALVPPSSDPEGDIRQAVLLTDVLLTTGGAAHDIDAAGQPGLDAAERWGIETYHALLVRSNMVAGRLREGRVEDAAHLIGTLSDDQIDVDRWVLHLDRALLDTVLGRAEEAARRVESLLAGFDTRIVGDDIEFLGAVATIHLWNGNPARALELLLPVLDSRIEVVPDGVALPALVNAARASADVSAAGDSGARQHLATLLALRARRPGAADSGGTLPPRYHRALILNLLAELARSDGGQTVKQWITAADSWSALSWPHHAAYCRWRGAQAALREGQGTVAARLLKRAAADAREHVPLSTAIRETAAGRRS